MTLSYLRYCMNRFLFGLIVILCAQPFPGWSQEAETTSPLPPTSTGAQESSAEPGEDHTEQWSREWLESRGIIFEGEYRAETFSNLRGGIDGKRGGEYLGSVDSTVTLDLNKLHLGRGAIVIGAQNLHGRGINDRKVGAVQAASNLDDAPFTKLIEAYFTDHVFGNRVTFKAGRLYADADFNTIETAGDFLNSSYGLIPTVPMPTYPAPQLGASVWTSLTSRVSLGAGIYTGAKLDALEETASPVSTGTFTVLETKVDPFSTSAAFHGSYRVGIWQQGRSSWNSHDLSSPARDYGLYATGEHWFQKPLSGGGNVGPSVFFQVGWSPSDRNEISSYWGVGAAYPGIVPKRPQDSVGIGVTQARLVAGNESVLELFYKVQMTKKVFLQPDMQWVNRPSGDGRNALLGGVRVGMSF